ncbi:MAG: M20/M25/M40 family metallo-hydrolase [Prevotella sp.]|nr:M20/M25/M40 family metallo-hydrolase [Staphylococcus sp.]MCM1351020.1 M20/M25/M40 family metallo-hydrolase [Prevotella sp.]
MSTELLFKMLETPSVSGHELEFQKMLIEELKGISDVTYTHHSYNVVHGIHPTSKMKVMLVAHIDEIGLVIEKIESNGICRLQNVGSIQPHMYVGQHVMVLHTEEDGTKKEIPGVIGPTYQMTSGELRVTDLKLDLGTSTKEETETLVAIGDVVIHQMTYMHLGEHRIAGRALDDKIGAYIAIETLKRVKEKKASAGVYVATTVGEETTGRGAKFAVEMLQPTCAIVLDVGSSTDVAYKNTFTHDTALGKGPILTIASHANSVLVRHLKEAAKRLNIPLQFAVEISRTYTDMDQIYDKQGGIPTELISIPLRYMHSSVEVCDIRDVEMIIALLVDTIIHLEDTETFNAFDEVDSCN